MTASAQSLADLIVRTVGREWTYDPDPGPGALSFYVDGIHFNLFVVNAEGYENIAVIGDPAWIPDKAEGFEGLEEPPAEEAEEEYAFEENTWADEFNPN